MTFIDTVAPAITELATVPPTEPDTTEPVATEPATTEAATTTTVPAAPLTVQHLLDPKGAPNAEEITLALKAIGRALGG